MEGELLVGIPDKGARIEIEERDHWVELQVRDDQVPLQLVSQMLGAITMGTALCACIPCNQVTVNRPKGPGAPVTSRIPLPRERPREWRAHHADIAATVAATTLTAWGFAVQVKEETDGQPATAAAAEPKPGA